ncbi:TIGR03667 family PPOX class F420-dependent oxidoreductase [Isoptericola sp. NPDC057391]|uniref:TIGR03667 family PPOX class F420-dependent oxidoreductase n=1 Tax=Isoptericola sp. NPDC057391 TaxID=3346117 RepID=UPI0036418CE4
MSAVSTVVDTATTFGARAAARLRDEEVVWLTTVDPHGTPQPTPVWFWWDGDDEVVIRSQPGTAKLRNVGLAPGVALHLNSTRSGGDVVVLLGEGRVDDAALTSDERAAYDAKYADGMRGLGMTPDGFHADYSVTLRVRVRRLRGF